MTAKTKGAAGLIALCLALPPGAHACGSMAGKEAPVSSGFLIGALPFFGVGFMAGAAACLPLGVVTGAVAGDFYSPARVCGLGVGLTAGAIGGGVLALPLALVIRATSGASEPRRR